MTTRPDFNPDDEATWASSMTTDEVASVMRITRKAIWSALSRGSFLPLPIALHPDLWRREDIQAWRRGEYREAIQTLRAKTKRVRRKVAA